jgi:hypothetical protein
MKLLTYPLEPEMAEPTSVVVAVLRYAHLCSLNRAIMLYTTKQNKLRGL